MGQTREEPMSLGVVLVEGLLAFLGGGFRWWTYWVNGSPLGVCAVWRMC